MAYTVWYDESVFTDDHEGRNSIDLDDWSLVDLLIKTVDSIVRIVDNRNNRQWVIGPNRTLVER